MCEANQVYEQAAKDLLQLFIVLIIADHDFLYFHYNCMTK